MAEEHIQVQEDRAMKSFIIVVLAAATGLATACTSKTTVLEPVTAAPAPAPAPAPMVEPAAGPSRRVIVTYTPPDGFPAAQRAAAMYCGHHFGVGTAQLVTDSPPGRATFACPGM
jgi:hypothetical protein